MPPIGLIRMFQPLEIRQKHLIFKLWFVKVIDICDHFYFHRLEPKICREEEEVLVNYVLGETSNHIGYGEAKTGKLDMKLSHWWLLCRVAIHNRVSKEYK